MFFVLISLFIVGTIFGSFSSVIITRLGSNTPGIIAGNSKCLYCNKNLRLLNLVPIFSYLLQKGKTGCCGKKLSSKYICLELIYGFVFSLTGYFVLFKSNFSLILEKISSYNNISNNIFNTNNINSNISSDLNLISDSSNNFFNYLTSFFNFNSNIGSNIFNFDILIYFCFLLVIIFVLLNLFIYDYLYQELPDQLSLFLLLFLIILLYFSPDFFYILSSINLDFNIFNNTDFYLNSLNNPNNSSNLDIFNNILAGVILYTIFYLKILIPGSLEALKKKDFSLILYIFVYYFLIIPEAFYDLAKKLVSKIRLNNNFNTNSNINKKTNLNKYKTSNSESKNSENSNIKNNSNFIKNFFSKNKDKEIDSWIGGGDLRLILILGLLSGLKIGLIGIFLSYLIGSIVGIFYKIFTGNNKIAFGPILIIGFLLSFAFHNSILNI